MSLALILLSLAAAPTADGAALALSAQPRAVPMPAEARAPGLALSMRASFHHQALWLEARVDDARPSPGAFLDLVVAFRDAGATSGGAVLRVTPTGLAPPPELGGLEPWAQGLVKASVRADPRGFVVTLGIPVRALPRFPARRPLVADVCLTYPGGDGPAVRSCPTGEAPVRLPEAWRAALAPAGDVEGIEGRPHGWVGFSRLHALTWARGEAALTAATLAELVAGAGAVEPRAAQVPVPPVLALPGGQTLLPVLTGRAPAGTGPACQAETELTLTLYLVQRDAARQALRWPVATCQLGRASRIELSGDGALVLGYTSGAEAHFTWASDHFERSELGRWLH
jgi:hypothetical protein